MYMYNILLFATVLVCPGKSWVIPIKSGSSTLPWPTHLCSSLGLLLSNVGQDGRQFAELSI